MKSNRGPKLLIFVNLFLGLIFLGYWVSPPGAVPWPAASVVAVWAVGCLLLEGLKGDPRTSFLSGWSIGFLGQLTSGPSSSSGSGFEGGPWGSVLVISAGIFAIRQLESLWFWKLDDQRQVAALQNQTVCLWPSLAAFAALQNQVWLPWVAYTLILSWGELKADSVNPMGVGRVLRPLKLLSAVLGVGFLGLASTAVGPRLLLLPVLLGYAFSQQNLLESGESATLRYDVAELDLQLQQALSSKSVAIESWKQLDQEKQGLEFLTNRLSHSSSWPEVGQALAAILGPKLGLTSFAFYQSNSDSIDDLEACHWVSPSPEKLTNFRLLVWGSKLLEVARTGQPCSFCPTSLQVGPVAGESALLVPLPGGALYLGRLDPNGAWGRQELHWLGWFVDRCAAILRNLQIRALQSQQLEHAQRRHQVLESTISGQQCLIEASRRFASHLDPSSLWSDMVSFLGSLFPLQSCCLVQAGRALLVGGEGPQAEEIWSEPFLAHLLEGQDLASVGYFAYADQAKWALPQIFRQNFQNILLVPVLGCGTLVITFWGQQALERSELELMQGIAQLLATALSRASLHQDVVTTYRKLEASQALWLQTHKSLALAQLSAGLAHELNSPLGAIRLSLEAAQVSKAESQKSKIEKALAACTAAQSIIERLGRLAAQQKEEVGSCDVVQIVRQILEQLDHV